MSSFMEKCLAGDALLDDIDDFIDEWHSGDGEVSLYQHLGMNRLEYSLWVNDPDVLPFIVTAHRQERGVEEVLEELDTLSMAARADSREKARQLMIWLKKEGLWE